MYFKILICLLFVFICGISSGHEPEVLDIITSPINSYTIQKMLGEGAFGKVFAVKDKSGKTFAMKWYKGGENLSSSGYVSSSQNVNNFLEMNNNYWYRTNLENAKREFELGQILAHPNIIKSYELFSDNKDHYLILELVQGQTLYQIPNKSLSAQDSIIEARQLAEALFYAYQMGYLYLDLHSDNIMVDNKANLKVIDLASFFTLEELFGVIADLTDSYYDYNAIERIIDQKFALKRGKILKQFFRKNPELLKKSLPHKNAKEGKNEIKLDKLHNIKFWFYSITEEQIYILNKSAMDRGQRLDLRCGIKRTLWELEEDISEGVEADLESYFDQLSSLLKV
jgi:hypothetical protein